MKKVLNWILERLKEKSTWGAIFTVLATVVGVKLSPAMQTEITTIGMAVVAIIAASSKTK